MPLCVCVCVLCSAFIYHSGFCFSACLIPLFLVCLGLPLFVLLSVCFLVFFPSLCLTFSLPAALFKGLSRPFSSLLFVWLCVCGSVTVSSLFIILPSQSSPNFFLASFTFLNPTHLHFRLSSLLLSIFIPSIFPSPHPPLTHIPTIIFLFSPLPSTTSISSVTYSLTHPPSYYPFPFQPGSERGITEGNTLRAVEVGEEQKLAAGVL